jgi:transcriptional regulator with XRE-family HTH domain
MNYGRALKTLRQARQLKQKELASRSGLDASYISQIESNKRIPSSAATEAIAKALDIPLYLLILFASDTEDLRGISADQARQLEMQLLMALIKTEKAQ